MRMVSPGFTRCMRFLFRLGTPHTCFFSRIFWLSRFEEAIQWVIGEIVYSKILYFVRRCISISLRLCSILGFMAFNMEKVLPGCIRFHLNIHRSNL